jgi:hypothetical protein
MLLSIVAYISLLIASPELDIKMAGSTAPGFALQVHGQDDLLEKCMQGALELRYRFKVKICRKRTAWFDDCKSEKIISQSLRFDPISETYKVTSDEIGDREPPRSMTLTSREDAVRELTGIPNLAFSSLKNDDPAFVMGERTYLRARVESECKGAFNETLANISTFLTLGLVKISGFDSGWIDFNWADAE